MAATKKNQRQKGDSTKPFDAIAGACPECGAPVQMYVPPERSLGGPVGYPALLLHYENAHTTYVAAQPRGWSTPPPPPKDDTWEAMPPAPEDWVPIDRRLQENNLPQDENVWPPARVPTRV